MRTLASIITLFVLTLTLAGCGGGSGCGSLTGSTSTGGSTSSTCKTQTPGGTSNVSSLSVSTSVPSISTDGTSTATITVLAKDANNNAMSGASVTLAASAGTLSGAAATTGANGTITATLSGAGVKAGTTITVTATSGSVTGQATVSVVATQQNITLLVSSPQMNSDNTKPVTITALVQDASNKIVTGVPINFQASSGAITPIQTTAGAAATPPVAAGTTDVNGQAQAKLTTPGNPLNRTITVTVTAGSTTATITVDVVGTKVSVNGPTSLVQNAQGSYSISLTDAGGNGISGQTVTLTSAKGNTLNPTSVTTGATGTAPFTMTAVNSGNDTITATWQTMTGTESVAVSNQNFVVTAPAAGSSIPVNAAVPVTITWTASGAPVTSGTVYLTSSRGTLSAASSPVTNGALSTAITISSTTAGAAIISATAVDGTGATVATAQSTVGFIATTPNAVSVQASPSTVALKGQSTLTATVTDPTGNPVQNKVVNFTLQDSTNGSLSSASATTDTQGQASVTYTASTGSSAPNGVIVTAQVQNTGITGTTTLTVGGQTVFLSLGTGNTIVELNQTQYELPYTVQAVDAAGNGVSGVHVTFSIQSVAYAPGRMFWHPAPLNSWYASDDYTVTSTYLQAGFCHPTTVNEYNGAINPTPPPAGVTPVVTKIPGSVASTDVGAADTISNGTAPVNVIYPKDHAFWVIASLTATATVSGTQSSTTAIFTLPGALTDYATQTIAPPGQFSPYGSSTTCY